MSAIYEKAVKRTFSDSLRSVFLVDDAFPSFADMFKKAKLTRFKEKDRAERLYRAFRRRQLPCDIENTFRANDIKMVERLRKCDLIVLDFHLDADDTDSAKAIEILRRLADSRHFNTVVVYTKADLKEAWLDIAANLRPDLRLKEFLAANEKEAAWWDGFDAKVLQTPTTEAIAQFLTDNPKPARAEVVPDIRQHGGKGNGGSPSVMAEIWLRHSVDKRRNASVQKLDNADAVGPRMLQGRLADGKPLWL
jgi:CheY-like chemotaxis protein